jgi:hypothetical protein
LRHLAVNPGGRETFLQAQVDPRRAALQTAYFVHITGLGRSNLLKRLSGVDACASHSKTYLAIIPTTTTTTIVPTTPLSLQSQATYLKPCPRRHDTPWSLLSLDLRGIYEAPIPTCASQRSVSPNFEDRGLRVELHNRSHRVTKSSPARSPGVQDSRTPGPGPVT